MKDETCVVDHFRCMGFGLCTSVCSTGALHLERLAEEEIAALPADRQEWAAQRS